MYSSIHRWWSSHLFGWTSLFNLIWYVLLINSHFNFNQIFLEDSVFVCDMLYQGLFRFGFKFTSIEWATIGEFLWKVFVHFFTQMFLDKMILLCLFSFGFELTQLSGKARPVKMDSSLNTISNNLLLVFLFGQSEKKMKSD